MRASLPVLMTIAASLAAQDPEARLLHWMDRIAQAQLDQRARRIEAVRTVAEAGQRQAEVRAKILEVIGGLPDYQGPLNARVTGRIERPKYVIEKVIFESLPGVLVTANVYRPSRAGRYPGVLLPLGHWDEGKPGMQRIAMNLALKGFVALAYDPLGQGERQQAYDRRLGRSLAGGSTEQHFMAGAQSVLAGESFARYRIWDAKRALDYLVSRPDVDAERIGCTGCSGGGTLTTYISALDSRIKVAAPACYMNSFRVLFSGPVGDSEQSLPNFLSSGLDQTDFVELFAPKPWLIASTLGDFFTPEGARQVYEEARRWYGIYKAEEKVRWVVGAGGHGTPLPVREAIYEWMIRWLNNGNGDAKEEEVEILPVHELVVTQSGQVSEEGSRDVYQVILERLKSRRTGGSVEDLKAEMRRMVGPVPSAPPMRFTSESRDSEMVTHTGVLETEPGLEIDVVLLVPRREGRKPGVVVVESSKPPSPLAGRLAAKGAVVLALAPRGMPRQEDGRRLSGDWLMNTRAWLIGKNLPALRAFDILRGVEALAARPDVDAANIRGVARGVSGVWLLMAAAADSRISRLWLDRTPDSLTAALEQPLHENLHAAVIPGFLLRWDIDAMVKAVAPRRILWTDPADWMGRVVRRDGDFRYRGFGDDDDRFEGEWMR